jgi:cytoskeletal protein RodZ
MSDRREETKQIKRVVDDETVEQLVEGRTPRRTSTTNVKRRRKKKKNRFALKSLITILAFVLVFVISFLVSYTYFSAPSNAPEENNLPAVGTPVKDNDNTDPDEKDDDYYATDNMKPQSADDIPLEDGKDEEPVDEKPAVIPEQKPSSTPEQKPASKPQNSGTSNSSTSSGVVDNKDNSEGLDFGL